MRRWALWSFGLAVCAAGVVAVGRMAPPGNSTTDLQAALLRVSEDPRDPAAWASLGDAQAAADEPAAAEQAYRTAIQLLNAARQADGRIEARLGFLLYAQGRDAEASDWLLRAKARGADLPLLDETLAQLSAAPPMGSRGGEPSVASADADRDASAPAGARRSAPARRAGAPPPTDAGVDGLDAAVPSPAVLSEPEAPPPDEACFVPLERRPSGALIVGLWLNGTWTDLIVDTGATSTVLNASAAAGVGATPTKGRVRAQTANGTVDMTVATVAEVSLEGRSVADLYVAVCDECIRSGADGLMGIDLQVAFDVQVDVVGRRLIFVECF